VAAAPEFFWRDPAKPDKLIRSRMTVSNTFTSGGARQISTNFDASFNSCTAYHGEHGFGTLGTGTGPQRRLRRLADQFN
jgi:hypothetical protein